MHKFGDKIRNVYHDKTAKNKLHDFLNNAKSTNIFDMKWQEWTAKYNLKGNKWLQHIYHIRYKWCPRMIDYFFTRMFTTKRREAMNNFVNMHVKLSFTLYEFVGSLNIVLLAL